MRKSDIVRTPRPRALEPIAWGMGILLVTAILVQLTHRGIDVLLALAAGFVLLSVERTLGDWIAESLGEPATLLLFVLVALVVAAYATTDTGQSKIRRLLAVADDEGIQPLVLWGGPTSAGPRLSGSERGSLSPIQAPITGGGAPSPTVGGTTTPATPATVDSERLSKGGMLSVGLKASPEVVVTGEAVTLRVVVRGGRAVRASALFRVNGHVITAVAVDDAGNALTSFTPAVPGFYTARVSISTSSIFSQEATATFNVLPGR